MVKKKDDLLKEINANEKEVLNTINKKKTVREQNLKRNKRSFVLTDDAVNQLALLKLVEDTDLSGIVEKAIHAYYIQNQDKLERVMELYEKYRIKK